MEAIAGLNLEIVEARIERARSRIGMRTQYEWDKGGVDPHATNPAEKGFLDSYGFVAWAINMSRRPRPDRPFWITPRQLLVHAAIFFRLDFPVLGCLVVIPDCKDKPGHMAIVSESRSKRDFSIVDCSEYSYRREGDAVAERPGQCLRGSESYYLCLRSDVQEEEMP